jgi:hypothetical protein
MIKTILRIYFALCVVYLSCASVAQSQTAAAVTQPVLSYILDSTHHLRPLIGIAGAASVGNPVDLGFDITQVAVSPAHDYVVAFAAGNGWPILLQVSSGALMVQSAGFAQTGAHPAATIDRVALSPTGSSAALFSSAEGRMYTFGSLSQSPVAKAQFDLSRLGAVTAFGVSDDGQYVVIGTSDGQKSLLYLAESGRQPRLVGTMSHAAAVAFLHNSSHAIVADDLQNTIFFMTNSQIFEMASASDGISAPVALATSNDNRRIFIANSENGSVITMSLAGVTTTPLYCNCAVTGLYPTNADSVFRLTDFSGSPVLLFDATKMVPRLTFAAGR